MTYIRLITRKAIKDHINDEYNLNNELLSSIGQRGGLAAFKTLIDREGHSRHTMKKHGGKKSR